MTKNITAVTAIPCGRRRDGSPLPRRPFEIVRAPEPFGDVDGRGRSRLWSVIARDRVNNTTAVVPAAVVWTDSIEAVSA